MASFPGGTTELYKFIYSHLEYPSEAKKWEVSGEVITQFVVDQNGDLRSIKVIKGLGYGLDEEAIRVIELMDKEHQWEPATLMGQPVPITYNLPIKFVL